MAPVQHLSVILLSHAEVPRAGVPSAAWGPEGTTADLSLEHPLQAIITINKSKFIKPYSLKVDFEQSLKREVVRVDATGCDFRPATVYC